MRQERRTSRNCRHLRMNAALAYNPRRRAAYIGEGLHRREGLSSERGAYEEDGTVSGGVCAVGCDVGIRDQRSGRWLDDVVRRSQAQGLEWGRRRQLGGG